MNAIVVSVLLVVIVVAFGRVFYDVELPDNTLAAFLVTLVVGAAAFSALGLGMSGFIPSADAAPAVINGTILPLMFISDIFIPAQNAPDWITTLGEIFPIKHFSEALQTSFNPFESASGFEPERLAVIAAWGAVGVVLALMKFEWEPRR
jgi:ABC-2 type transport system permease protein